MNARRVLGATVGAIGAAVVGNRLLAHRAGDLANPLPGIERTYRWRGIETTYTVAGDPNDPDVLLCHGIYAGASSYEFAPIVERLADDYRVFAVDLPGFARSDRPPLVYSPRLYAEFLRDFADDVTDDPIVIASSLTGAYAVQAADESGIDHLVLICPTDETATERPWLRTLLRTPVVGTTLFNLLVSKPAIRYYFDRDGYYDPENVDPRKSLTPGTAPTSPAPALPPPPSPPARSTPSSIWRPNSPPSRRPPRSSGGGTPNSSRSGMGATSPRPRTSTWSSSTTRPSSPTPNTPTSSPNT